MAKEEKISLKDKILARKKLIIVILVIVAAGKPLKLCEGR
jgi:hypothetical protein